MEKEIKKILIITYYFPPAGGPGVQRWLKFIKYLPEFGLQPIVYIPENPTYPIVDENLVAEIPSNVRILKHKIFEPYRFANFFSKNKINIISSGIIPSQKKQTFVDKFLLWVRGNLFIPDARIFWVKPSVKFLSKYVSENDINVIITTGPPHSLHLIGLELKQKLNLEWIADFRDPWTTIGYHSALKLSKNAQQKHIELEKKVLQTADKIIVTSKTTKTEFAAITSKPIRVITNGFEIEESIKSENIILDAKFSLAHIGSFLSDRNPKILWECLLELINEIPEFKNHLEIKLIGKVSQEILDTISSFKLNKFVNNLGYVSHEIAIEHQKKSQILLLIEIDSEETKCIIPGKIFEYMVSSRPIIGIGPKNADFEEILINTNSGKFVNYSQKRELKQILVAHYQAFLIGNSNSNPTNLEQYSRKNLTKQLADLINSKI